MKTRKIKMFIAGVAAATCLMASPAFASKTSLSESTLGKVTGRDNVYTFGDTATSSILNSNSRGANIMFGWYQWTDDHSADQSLDKGANDQSGVNSAVQQNVTAGANSLAWGWISQNELTNGGKVTLTGVEMNMAYGVTTMGGF